MATSAPGAPFIVRAQPADRVSRVAGSMLCYGANFLDMYARAAEYVGRILKGQKPADMAIEQPTKFQFIINVKTARSLDIIIPNTVLRRADEVIQ